MTSLPSDKRVERRQWRALGLPLILAFASVGCSDGNGSGAGYSGTSGGTTQAVDAASSSGTTSGGATGSNTGSASGGAPSTSGDSTNGDSTSSDSTSVASSTDTTGSGSGGVAGSGGGGGDAGTGGMGSGGTGPIAIDPDALFAAPDGTMGASGTIDDPTTFASAVGRVEAGGTIYLRGGTYPLGSTIGLDQDGADGTPVSLFAYPLDDERPLLDFSSMSENSSNRGLSLSADYWHMYGIDVFGAGDNCLFVSGSHNTIEFSTFSECADTGLQLGNGASDNLVLNCDSYFNADSTLENADGFAAKLDVGTGNKFVGCRAWNNLDDGWDGYLRPADNVTTTYEDCWAIDNGKLKNGSVGVGDGNGFKSGGSDGKNLRHNASYTRCIAAGNVYDGFDHNSNRGDVTILNSAAHDNGSNINFGTTNIAASLTIKNTISVGNNGSLDATNTDIANNSWQNGLAATSDDFVSLDTSLLKAPRKSDGSLPDIDYLKLVSGSDLRNAGTDLGLPYNGSAPDLGPFESEE